MIETESSSNMGSQPPGGVPVVNVETGAAGDAASTPPAPQTRSATSRVRGVAQVALRYGMIWALIILLVVARLVYPTFLSIDNLRNVMSQNAPVAIIAVGMTLVIICGGFDLSVGSIYGLGAVTFATVSSHASPTIALLVTLLVGCLAGLVNALIITQLKVNPFVATLATSSGFLGLAYMASNNNPVNLAPGFDTLGLGQLGGIPISGLIAIGVLVGGGVALSRTILGQNIYAVGGSAEAARLAGLRVQLVRGSTYLIVGTLSGLAGAIDCSKLGVAQADTGQDLPLVAITVVILGGTALLGGEGAMWRTVIGLLIVATLTNLFDSLAINTSVQLVVQCAVLVTAVSFDHLVRSASVASRKS
ncbi:ABC transporter permease [Acidothermaceae bacterium B102]|nr:ABC transporter permease [Acidothermaceae bacterium B102]